MCDIKKKLWPGKREERERESQTRAGARISRESVEKVVAVLADGVGNHLKAPTKGEGE